MFSQPVLRQFWQFYCIFVKGRRSVAMSAQGGLRRSRAGRAQEKVGPGPPCHLAHLSNLAHIAHAVHLAQTHFGRPAHVATLASKTQLAIIIITMAIAITTAMVSPKSLPAESRNSLANNGGSRHMRRYTETINEHPFPPRFKVDALGKIVAKYNWSDLPPTLITGDGGGIWSSTSVR